ncbi:MAG: DMT family transporter [Balneolaceae bacterium]|nr:DMT family transporter [Balneolaceae bacterium]
MSNQDQAAFSKVKVYGLLAFGISAIGFSPILVKLATESSPYLIAAIRTAFAFLILLPAYGYQKKAGEFKNVTTKEHLLVASSGIMLGLHLIAWISSIYYTSIASASVLVTIHPILIILIERFAFKIRFKALVWIGVVVAFTGSVLIGYSDYDGETTYANPLLGNSLAVLAAVIFAGYFLIGNRIRQKRNWFEYVFPVYGYAALTCVIALFIVVGFTFEVTAFVVLIGFALAVGPQIAGHGSLNFAVKYISPTLLSTLILFEPAVSSVFAYLIFGEVPLFMSFVGMMIVLLGIMLTWTKSKRGEA